MCSRNGLKPNETDFTAQLSRIRDADPQVIFLSAQQIESIHILKQARELGIPADVPFIGAILSADDIESAEGAAEGAITFAAWRSDADTPGNQAFRREIPHAVRPRTQHLGCAVVCRGAYPCGSHRECRNTGFGRDSGRFGRISAILDTILGQFSFSEVGDGAYDPTVLIVKDGKLGGVR